MSTTSNTDAVANQAAGGSGEFHARVERDEPMTKHGHQPGKLVGNDNVPEFQAQTLPPGSAPSDRTFRPNNVSEVPPVQQDMNDVDEDAPQASAADTIGGATSAEVHTGLGHPGQGQTSAELRNDGQQGRKNVGASLEGVGKSGATGKTVNPQDPAFANQRALDRDEAVVGRGTVGGPSAEERIPEGAETVAAESEMGRDKRA